MNIRDFRFCWIRIFKIIILLINFVDKFSRVRFVYIGIVGFYFNEVVYNVIIFKIY